MFTFKIKPEIRSKKTKFEVINNELTFSGHFLELYTKDEVEM